MMTSSSPPLADPLPIRQERLRSLQARLGTAPLRSRTCQAWRWPGLEGLLPERPLPAGSLVELLPAQAGCGAWELALELVRHLQRERVTPILIDNQQEFFPPGAAELGLDLDHLMVVQPRSLADQLWAMEQALRCEGNVVVLSTLGRIPANTYRRLKLAAERGMNLGLFVREASLRCSPSWADFRLLVEPARSSTSSRRYKVTALNSLEGTATHSVLERCDDSGALSVVPPLADSKTTAILPCAS
ncbi:ImuA family protein [Planctomicrobium sp. SH661]|uniref:ImuA family protein n=1 Tax=Planctomicrobium sp. SH661 TaxID=3448124 RepID=UPI003F5C4512